MYIRPTLLTTHFLPPTPCHTSIVHAPPRLVTLKNPVVTTTLRDTNPEFTAIANPTLQVTIQQPTMEALLIKQKSDLTLQDKAIQYCNHCVGQINNTQVRMLVDTGATLSIMSETQSTELNLKVQKYKST